MMIWPKVESSRIDESAFQGSARPRNQKIFGRQGRDILCMKAVFFIILCHLSFPWSSTLVHKTSVSSIYLHWNLLVGDIMVSIGLPLVLILWYSCSWP
ncbi:hypothetical protein J3R30DRAFT_3509230 [Lentinula aciculospora]|uniref:Uncharacterized protein n=1 Tax=Lentinula aciculospora TaxID=153920 RepID=A0A9W9A7A4_9AGAR|nr:hypothetical protein J3R30DRAFT_3509230 [Lentinula aciculospora]